MTTPAASLLFASLIATSLESGGAAFVLFVLSALLFSHA
jgi:hypothetical protein